MMPWLSRIFQRRRVHTLPPREGYDCWAEDYDAERNPVIHLEERAMADLMPELDGKRVLDAGCGTGRYAARAYDLGASRIIGVDISGKMLARAHRKGREKLVQADLCVLPLTDAQFDVVFSTFALEHVRDFALAIEELSRVTAPGGILLLADFHPFGAFLGWDRSFRRYGGRRLHIYTIERTPHLYEEYVHACRRAGLVIEDVVEPRIDESVRSYFEAEGSLDVYDAYRGLPLVLMMRLRKQIDDR